MKAVKLIDIDIIILSYAKNDELKKLTEQTIDTCLKSEKPTEIRFNIVVIESNKELEPYQFEHTKTIYPDCKFGFHRYLNIGIKATENEYICFCNNDLIFHKKWASEILKAMKNDSQLSSASTFCPIFNEKSEKKWVGNVNYGYENGTYFTGWCFLVKRTAFTIIGLFDEKFEFWFSDDDFRLTLKKHKLKNALVVSSKVEHLTSETIEKVSAKKKIYLKFCSYAYFRYKWQHHCFLIYMLENLKYRIKIVLTCK